MSNIVKRVDSSRGGRLAQKANALLAKRGPPSPLSPRTGFIAEEMCVVFATDSTGSMYEFFERGKQAIERIAREVGAKNQHVRFCYIPYKDHGDEPYFDGQRPFLATAFTNNPRELNAALARVTSDGGGGCGGFCAIEDVLHYLNQETVWLNAKHKVIVIIGDMPPHGVLDSFGNCPREYNYKEEVAKLKAKGARIYSVYCCETDCQMSERRKKIQAFYRWIASETGGVCLDLSDIDELATLLIGICMQETGNLREFVDDLKRRGQLAAKTEQKLLLLEGKK